ncbi:MFS transporter [Nocardioides acrostichi]|uniref:MFS transporter n=1 Tax=Nocardioides acrostichi TaxID=2784339 RepID=A0A930UZH0_9ACTN|nr:MFS transporter [Nocardioides acrostichi]MBF4163758.1 MFS transporter [Nocardioides acrostichi]
MVTAPRASTPTLSVVALCFGGLAASLTQTMVIPIQAQFPQLLGTSPANAAWVITVTLLAGAVTMPVSGRLADMVGKQRIVVLTTVALLVGSIVCALSDSLLPMLVGRGIQGVSMGFIPVGIALLREIVPPRLAGSAVAAMSATLGVGGAIGLPLAAWIVQSGSWHALFWVSAAVAAAVLVAVLTLVPHVHDAAPGRFDVAGAIGLVLGLSAFLVGLSKASVWGWSSGRTLGFMLGGVAVLLVWGMAELRVAEPLVDLRTTARLPVLLTNLAAVAVGMGMMAQAVIVPQLLELPDATGYGLGQTILQAGLWMAPGGLMMMLFAPVSSRLMGTIGAKATLMIGAGVLGAGYLLALGLTSAPWQLAVASVVISIGVGIGYAAMPTLVLDAVPLREAGSAVSVNTLMRSVGTTSAAALMGTVLTSSTTAAGVPTEGAFSACFVVGAVAAFTGVAIAAFIPRRSTRHDVPVPAAHEPAVASR